MVWYGTFDAVFFITIATVVTGCIGVLARYCFRSRCDNLSLCCGFIQIHRNTEMETRETLREMEIQATRPPEIKRQASMTSSPNLFLPTHVEEIKN